jgi:hypothetical protein
MGNLEIGIPAYRNLNVALKKAAELRGGGFTGRIHISVNDPSSEDASLSLASQDPLLDISLQSGNLGLYGNFRYLVNTSKAGYFMWLALDDEPDWGVIGAIYSEKTHSTLYYSRHFLNLANQEAPGNLVYGPINPLSAKNIFNFDPSAIFGAWDSKWLQSFFPKCDFDWLDSYLLTAAHLQGKITLLPGQRTIGAVLGKRPHNVSGTHHRIWGWFAHCSVLILRTRRLDLLPAFVASYLGRIRMIFRQLVLASQNQGAEK